MHLVERVDRWSEVGHTAFSRTKSMYGTVELLLWYILNMVQMVPSHNQRLAFLASSVVACCWKRKERKKERKKERNGKRKERNNKCDALNEAISNQSAWTVHTTIVHSPESISNQRMQYLLHTRVCNLLWRITFCTTNQAWLLHRVYLPAMITRDYP